MFFPALPSLEYFHRPVIDMPVAVGSYVLLSGAMVTQHPAPPRTTSMLRLSSGEREGVERVFHVELHTQTR